MLENDTSKLRRLPKSANDESNCEMLQACFACVGLSVTAGLCNALRREGMRRKPGQTPYTTPNFNLIYLVRNLTIVPASLRRAMRDAGESTRRET
jgi:hypothetical protein